MSRRLVVASFEHEGDILGVTREAREAGLKIVDVYAPYAVHGMDRAMAMPSSRLSWVCFIAGATGAVLKLWFEIWTAAVDWPVNVGGKPWNSLPAFVPVTFEVMVLFAGLSTVAAFFLVSGLRPGRKARVVAPGVTDDRFALVIEETDGAFDGPAVRRMLERHHAAKIEERQEEVGR
jgi:hypothetical protein